MSCPPTVPAGERRCLVRIQTESRTPDGQGGYSVSWATLRDVWCSVKEMSDWERKKHDQLKSGAMYKIRMLWIDGNDIDPAIHRLSYNGKIFNIRGVEDEEERHTVIRLNAEEGVLT